VKPFRDAAADLEVRVTARLTAPREVSCGMAKL